MNKKKTTIYKISINNDNTHNITIKNENKTYTKDINIYKKLLTDIIKSEKDEYTNYMKKINSIYSSQTFENNNVLINNESNSDNSLIQKNDNDVEEKILILLSNNNVEWGMLSDFDKFVIDNIYDENVLRSISKIFYDNYQNEDIIVKILNAIANVEYEEVKPYGQMMAIASFAHKSMVVQQKAIEAFENWKNEDSINALESVRFTEPWMQRYVDKIINNLKEEVILNA